VNRCFIIDYELRLLLSNIRYGWVTQMPLFGATTSFPSVKAVFLRLFYYTYHPSSLWSDASMRFSMHPSSPLPFGGLLFVSFHHVAPRTTVVFDSLLMRPRPLYYCWILLFVLDVFIVTIIRVHIFCSPIKLLPRLLARYRFANLYV
jgi:hypothetical protein